jgi:hypothetical protein
MIRAALGCTLLALSSTSGVQAQLASTRFINLVDTPAAVTYSASGQAQVQLHPTAGAIIQVAGFRKVSIRIGSTQATSLHVIMGKLSGTTVGARFTRPINQQIHTFDILGPELALWLIGGPPGTTENVLLWVYLSS